MRDEDTAATAKSARNSKKSLLIFDPSDGGHHAGYVLHFLKYACNQAGRGTIYLAVPTSMMSEGSEVYRAANECGLSNVKHVALDPELFERFQGSGSLIWGAWLQWRLMQDAIARTEPDHCLAMYIDHLLLPLAVGFSPGCELTGIYFRPTFHYPTFDTYSPSLRERVRALRQEVILRLALRSPWLQQLFCLDPFVPNVINAMAPRNKAVALPDPVQPYGQGRSNPSLLRGRLGIDSDRIVFLLFGVISERKGVFELLAACGKLEARDAARMTLLMVGPVVPDLIPALETLAESLRDTSPLRIILIDRFVPDHEIPPYFEAGDVVITPYRRHVGMSAVIVRSAAAGKPVLASDYGLLGEVVRREGLGMTIDSSRPEEIARAMADIARQEHVPGFDPEAARRFAARNSAEAFGRTLFETILNGG